MELSDYRKELDSIDAQMLELFKQRMNTVRGVAEYKKENKLPVLQQGREREILAAAAAGAGEELEDYARTFFATLMDVSRSYQERLTAKGGVISETITNALKNTPPIFPKHGTVACQGVEGAYSQLACDKLFTAPSISYFKNFEGVFAAVEQGLCEYGILPGWGGGASSCSPLLTLPAPIGARRLLYFVQRLFLFRGRVLVIQYPVQHIVVVLGGDLRAFHRVIFFFHRILLVLSFAPVRGTPFGYVLAPVSLGLPLGRFQLFGNRLFAFFPLVSFGRLLTLHPMGAGGQLLRGNIFFHRITAEIRIKPGQPLLFRGMVSVTFDFS